MRQQYVSRLLVTKRISRQICVRDEYSAAQEKACCQRVGLTASEAGPQDFAGRSRVTEPRSVSTPLNSTRTTQQLSFVCHPCAARQWRYFYGTKSRSDHMAQRPYLARTCSSSPRSRNQEAGI